MTAYFSYPTGGPISGTEVIGPVRQNGQDVSFPLSALGSYLAPTILTSAASFGAKGDGITDDTTAVQAALNSGVPVQFAGTTYLVNGNVVVTASKVRAFGTPGVTRFTRTATPPNAYAWFDFQAPDVRLEGLIFDANATVSSSQPSVQMTGSVTYMTARWCQFLNAQGAAGAGLLVNGNPSGTPHYEAIGCVFQGNAQQGAWFQTVWNVLLANNTATANGADGLLVNTSAQTSTTLARRIAIVGNLLGANGGCGLSTGNYNTVTTGQPVWGPTVPQVQQVLIASNIVFENTGAAQMIVDNDYQLVIGNQVTKQSATYGGTGINANCRYSRIAGNMLNVPNCSYGIDTGGSQHVTVSGNDIYGGSAGSNPGGSQYVTIEDNHFVGQTYCAISLYAVEDDGQGNAVGHEFPFFSKYTTIRGNSITVGSGGAKGIVVRDNPLYLTIEDNDFYDAGSGGDTFALDVFAQALIKDNRWNGARQYTTNPYGSSNIVQLSDVYDQVRITNTNCTVGQLITYTALTTQSAKEIVWLTITNGGSGYTHATATITDSTGTAANFYLYCYGGQVIGARLGSGGSGYTSPTVTITGDGSGATATAQVGCPLYPDRRIEMVVQNGATVDIAGTLSINQQNAGNVNLVAANQTVLTFSESYANWIVK